MPTSVQLARYDNAWFDRGRAKWVEALWLLVEALLVRSWIPGAAHRRMLLCLFGAKIGRGVDIKPGIRVKFPWRLSVGDYSWIGEKVWIDNLASVEIGSNCCLSQDTYLCTGSHDWTSSRFDLIVRSIVIEDGAWIAARATVGPGVRVGEGAMLALGSVATNDLDPWTIYRGVPAVAVRKRHQIGEFGSRRARPRTCHLG